jgi:hypothetical protein
VFASDLQENEPEMQGRRRIVQRICAGKGAAFSAFDAFQTLQLPMASDSISLLLLQGGSLCDASFDRHRVAPLVLSGRAF